MSLSRLNHREPRSQTHPEIVKRTAPCHHQSTDAFFPQAEAVFDDTTPLDTAVAMLELQPALGECLVRPLLRPRERLAVRLLGRHADDHPRKRERQAAEIL